MATVEECRKLFAIALSLNEEGKYAETISLLERLRQIDDSPLVRILHAIVLPQIYASLDEVTRARERSIQLLKELHREGFTMDIAKSFAIPWFSIAYQGQNDLEAQRLLAGLYRAPGQRTFRNLIAPSFKRQLRIGILSAYFRDGHTIGKLTKGLFASINRDDFFVVALSLNRQEDETLRFVQDHADAFVELPPDPPLARRLIAGQKLDILYYTDIGMEPNSYTLAQTRLAPVQCATWGHPDTTGISTIDYFISSEGMDLPSSQAHYSEKLVRLQHLAVYYYRPKLPTQPATRAEFGLPEGFNLYGIPQTLIKFHPSFDGILARILTKDPKGLLVLLRGNRQSWEEMLLARFSRTMAGVADRVRFVERQSFENFLRLNSLFDVLLDPPDFGGGNTSYEAFAMGIPIVTMPSSFLRGRITFAQYKEMDVLDCIAQTSDNYVDLAVRIANERAFHDSIRQKILKANLAIFENLDGIKDLETFLIGAVEQSRTYSVSKDSAGSEPP